MYSPIDNTFGIFSGCCYYKNSTLNILNMSPGVHAQELLGVEFMNYRVYVSLDLQEILLVGL